MNAAVDLLRRHSSGADDEKGAKSALLDLHGLMLPDAPETVHDAYERIEEGDLRRPVRRAHSDAKRSGTTRTLSELVLEVGARIRALDAYIHLDLAVARGPQRNASKWLHGDRAYIIPRPASRHRVRGGHPYSRRGLLYNRVLPTSVRGMEICPILVDRKVSGEGAQPSRIWGAALMEGLSHCFERPDEKTFIVSDIACDGLEELLERQVASSIEDGCLAVVWPELGLPRRGVEFVTGLLRGRLLDETGTRAPAVVVTGSQHEAVGDVYENVATVLDGYGALLFRHAKSHVFVHPEMGREAIRRGRSLPVLVNEAGAMAVAICKDFCDQAREPLYLDLDLDAVLVPSMGGNSTMDGHQITAQRMYVKYGTVTFVVQQMPARLDVPEGGDRRLGYVLPPTPRPREKHADQLRTSLAWSAHTEQAGTGRPSKTL